VAVSFRERLFAHGLHTAARLALLVATPLTAKRLVDGLGRRLPPYPESGAAAAAAHLLRGSGACLSRALTIAARLPRSEVVFGVDPRGSAGLAAHAWVELEGGQVEGLVAGDVRRFEEIARLR